MIRTLLITAALFAFVQAGTAEQNGSNNPRGKFLKPHTDTVQLTNRGLASWKKEAIRDVKDVQTGKASWYGPGFHGKTTKYGDVFNMNKVSFAHNTLPEDTIIRVTNLKNGRSVVGRVNDTGSFGRKYGRIVDLSQEAMRRIGGIHDGVVPVKIEVLHVPQRT